jgi:hypothetical protein
MKPYLLLLFSLFMYQLHAQPRIDQGLPQEEILKYVPDSELVKLIAKNKVRTMQFWFHAEGQSSMSNTYTFDTRGNAIELVTADGRYRWTAAYNARHQMIRQSFYNPDDTTKIDYILHFMFDDRGNSLGRKTEYPDSLIRDGGLEDLSGEDKTEYRYENEVRIASTTDRFTQEVYKEVWLLPGKKEKKVIIFDYAMKKRDPMTAYDKLSFIQGYYYIYDAKGNETEMGELNFADHFANFQDSLERRVHQKKGETYDSFKAMKQKEYSDYKQRVISGQQKAQKRPSAYMTYSANGKPVKWTSGSYYQGSMQYYYTYNALQQLTAIDMKVDDWPKMKVAELFYQANGLPQRVVEFEDIGSFKTKPRWDIRPVYTYY